MAEYIDIFYFFSFMLGKEIIQRNSGGYVIIEIVQEYKGPIGSKVMGND